MIKKKTVFILGAGASMPYGFPSGAELRNYFCEGSTRRQFFDFFTKKMGISRQDLADLSDSFLRSSLPSIDSFLAKRQNYAELGKLIIAYLLCQREDPANLFRSPDVDDHWYSTLWAAMTQNTPNADLLSQNKIRFVTFNYDRSLEYFLHEATKHTYGIGDKEALAASGRIPIIHVYGSLGRYDFKSTPDSRPYEASASADALRLAAKALKVIPEAREEEKSFMQARNWFEWAERICFLGFGFDPLNMERLGLHDVLEWLKEKNQETPWIVASVLGKTDAEISSMRSNYLSHASSYLTLKDKNVMALRNSGFLNG